MKHPNSKQKSGSKYNDQTMCLAENRAGQTSVSLMSRLYRMFYLLFLIVFLFSLSSGTLLQNSKKLKCM